MCFDCSFSKKTMTNLKELEFCIGSSEKEKAFVLQIPIPCASSIPELSARLLTKHKIPFYVEEDLKKSLEEFVRKETIKYHDDIAEEAIKKLKNSDEEEIQELIHKWANAFKQEHVRFAEKLEDPPQRGSSFPEMYHKLIHSPALETMLNLEHSYAVSVGELVHSKDRAVAEMQQRQSSEMERAIPKVGVSLTDHDINRMATRHFTETQSINEYWDTKISALKETQKREFHEWVLKVHEDYQSGTGSPGYLQRVRALSEATPLDSDWTPQPQSLEESFTIHLGSQLKLMHNLRLLSADVLDLCRHRLNKVGGTVVPQPQRLQTAISLYSNSLSGLVLLVDNRVNAYSGIKREFASVCRMSTEFHFDDIDAALDDVRAQGRAAAEWRARGKAPPEGSPAQVTLRTGDFYVTRHSNLSEVHAVFHLVADDTLRSADVNSRHPTILGLRNILRVAHEHDVCTVTLPLLLVHEMSEEMTIQWCLKRAELMFKCIKGFMIEMASLVGDETRTVQFLVPKGISEELFSSLSNLLSTVFRISNPVVLK